MRVLLVTSDFPPFLSGVGDYTDRLAQHLSEHADVTVVTTAGDAPDRPYAVRADVERWDRAEAVRVAEVARDFDVMHVQYPGVRWGRSLWPNRLPGLTKTPTVVTFHEYRSMRTRWRLRASLTMRGAAAVVCVDDEDLGHAKRWSRLVRPLSPPQFVGIPIAPNVTTLPATDTDRRRWREELGVSPEARAVVFFGILYRHKGLDELLDAMRPLWDEGHWVDLIVVGDFDREDEWTRSMTTRLTGDKRINWQRGVPLEQVSRCLHAADVAALPFHSGAGPNRSSLLACAAHALPTITTDGPCTPADFRAQSPFAWVPVGEAKPIAEIVAVAAAILSSRLRSSPLQ